MLDVSLVANPKEAQSTAGAKETCASSEARSSMFLAVQLIGNYFGSGRVVIDL